MIDIANTIPVVTSIAIVRYSKKIESIRRD